VFVFVNHAGGTWQIDEMADQAAKADLAEEYYLDHARSRCSSPSTTRTAVTVSNSRTSP
jgi:hypothetical protein